MLAMLLQAAQQAKQISPNVYVTVQQPPAGMAEWEKTLITAAVGALLGIFSNTFMEFIRPVLVRVSRQRSIGRHIDGELRSNLDTVAVVRIMLNSHPQHVIGGQDGMTYSVGRMINLIKDERYRFYLETEKLLMYEIDSTKRLENFYEITREVLPSLAEEADKALNGVYPGDVRRIDFKEYQEIDKLLEAAIYESKWYFAARKSGIVQRINAIFPSISFRSGDDDRLR